MMTAEHSPQQAGDELSRHDRCLGARLTASYIRQSKSAASVKPIFPSAASTPRASGWFAAARFSAHALAATTTVA